MVEPQAGSVSPTPHSIFSTQPTLSMLFHGGANDEHLLQPFMRTITPFSCPFGSPCINADWEIFVALRARSRGFYVRPEENV